MKTKEEEKKDTGKKQNPEGLSENTLISGVVVVVVVPLAPLFPGISVDRNPIRCDASRSL